VTGSTFGQCPLPSLMCLLAELGIKRPAGPVIDAHLVSSWSGKFVYRLSAGGAPWAYVRHLPGPVSATPDRGLHLRLANILDDIGVGPPVLGITQHSEALGVGVTVVEGALEPVCRDSLAGRAPEAIRLIARLHGSNEVRACLEATALSHHPEKGMTPFDLLLAETRLAWSTAAPAAAATAANELAARLLDHAQSSIKERPAAAADLLRVPAHGDPNYSNFGIGPLGELRMLDFEDLSLTHPLADLGSFLTWYVPHQYQRRELLQTYQQINSPADMDALLDLMRLWVPVRYLRIAAHWLRRYGDAAVSAKEDQKQHALNALIGGLRDAASMLPGAHVEAGELDVARRTLADLARSRALG
jgi:hypothetical protein